MSRILIITCRKSRNDERNLQEAVCSKEELGNNEEFPSIYDTTTKKSGTLTLTCMKVKKW